MSSINIENQSKREKLRYLLRLLSVGKLPKEYAGDLKVLLMDELKKVRRNPNDKEDEKELGALIQILDAYMLGKVKLKLQPELIVSNISNITSS